MSAFLSCCAERLEKPTITDLFNTVENGYCVMGLRCSSILQGTNISWKSDASQVNEAFFQKRVGNATELFVFFKSNASRNVTLTCVAANDDSEEFEVVGKTCQGKTEASVTGTNGTINFLSLSLLQ